MKLGTLVRINHIEDTEKEFHKLRSLGFSACQLVYKPEKYKKEDAIIIKNAAKKYGVDICAQFCGYYDSDTVWDNYYGYMTAGLGVEAYRTSRLNYLRDAADFAALIGIKDIIIHAGFIPNNPFSAEYPPLLAAVKLLCEHLEKMEMNLLLETGGESAVSLLRLIKGIGSDNIFINLDPANMLMYGYANPVDALYTVGKFVRNMHGKDGTPPTDPYKLGDETPVGEGLVDFPKLLEKLKELGYDRYIIIEREISGEKQTGDIISAKEYFEKLLNELNFEVE